jgi:hypothetical protein
MVEVFKTDVQQPETAQQLIACILSLFPGNRVNFDLHDCDNILRIEGDNFSAWQIIAAVNASGYRAELL